MCEADGPAPEHQPCRSYSYDLRQVLPPLKMGLKIPSLKVVGKIQGAHIFIYLKEFLEKLLYARPWGFSRDT